MSFALEESKNYCALTETALEEALPATDNAYSSVVEAMRYSLLSGGKRVRATLLLATFELFAEKHSSSIFQFAAAIEMVHAYSLIHDDLPCMDDDALRRGKPSCHIAYGESTALLAGDALLTLAFETMCRPQTEFPPTLVLECIRVLSTASGYQGMIGGQVLDLQNERKTVTLQDLEQADQLKTGALLIAAFLIGGILGGAEPQEQKRLRLLGQKVGLVFQIVDDVLDYSSTTEALGKPAHSDADNQKNTYVDILGIDRARREAAILTDEALQILRSFGKDTIFLEEYVSSLANRTN